MRRKNIAATAMLAGMLILSGCSTLKWIGGGFYDREAYKQCEDEISQEAKRACYDRLDDARRERNSEADGSEDGK